MARKNDEGFLNKVKTVVLPIVSGIAFIFLLWMFFYGKVKASDYLAPIIEKLPKDEIGLVKTTEQVLGTAVEKVRGGNAKKVLDKGSAFFEESDYTAPAREMRDDVKQRIDEAVASAKELPAKEVKHIQREFCRQWLGDEIFISTESGETSETGETEEIVE